MRRTPPVAGMHTAKSKSKSKLPVAKSKSKRPIPAYIFFALFAYWSLIVSSYITTSVALRVIEEILKITRKMGGAGKKGLLQECTERQRGMGALDPDRIVEADSDSDSASEVCSHHEEFDRLENFDEEDGGSSLAGSVDASGRCQDLFSDVWLDSAALCWAHMEKAHNFNLQDIREVYGRAEWDIYCHIRLIGYLRRMGPEAANALLQGESRELRFGRSNPFWTDDDLLIPVDSEDPLLFDDAAFGGDEDFEQDAHEQEGVDRSSCTSTSTEAIVNEDGGKEQKPEVGSPSATSTSTASTPQPETRKVCVIPADLPQATRNLDPALIAELRQG
ncbi:unnamed protein product [Amoebophrya sp. A25]|nr:unnamed protein product [Amoebophrya sp. A25]|eukprot:GSA25T00005182001.1